MRAWTFGRPGHRMSTNKSRGNESSDSVFVAGSPRTSMSVSERGVSTCPGPNARLS
jgi:hypothetical protein